MKIAVLSDIHGNSYALEAVLEEAKSKDISHLLILGDIVGYYYYPEVVLDMLSEWSYDLIKGNHEKILEDLVHDRTIADTLRLKYGSGHKCAIEKLNQSQLLDLKNLSDVKTVERCGLSFLMCHGSPWSNDYYIYPDSTKRILQQCDSKEHDFVLIGHTHRAFAVKNEHSVLINPGSVGQSRDVGGKASWCIINTENSSFSFVSTVYSIDKLLIDIEAKDPDINYLKEVLKRI